MPERLGCTGKLLRPLSTSERFLCGQCAMLTLLAILVVACLLTLVTTAVVRGVAERVGFVDRPDLEGRKRHRGPVALGGGLAVLFGSFSVLLVLVAVRALLPADARAFAEGLVRLGWGGLTLFAAATLLAIVGFADDRVGLRGRQKLLGQLVAVGLFVLSGLFARSIQLLGYEIDLGLLALPFAAFWLLGAINSFNFLDGMDGVAGSVGLAMSVTIAAIAYCHGQYGLAAIAAALAGGLIAFLCFNLPPASIFLGDAGSMLVGGLLGALAFRLGLDDPRSFRLLVPLAIWTLPVFDCSVAILRRKLTGRSVFDTDRAHLHHRLKQRGLSDGGVVAAILALCAFAGLGAWLAAASGIEWHALVAAAIVPALLLGTCTFGTCELLMLARRLAKLGLSFFRLRNAASASGGVIEMTRLQGSGGWQALWQTAVEEAKSCHLLSLSLDVNYPARQEGFYASWNNHNGRPEPESKWSASLPLMAGGRQIGRLELVGEAEDGSTLGDKFAALSVLLERLNFVLHQILSGNTELVAGSHGGVDCAKRGGLPNERDEQRASGSDVGSEGGPAPEESLGTQ